MVAPFTAKDLSQRSMADVIFDLQVKHFGCFFFVFFWGGKEGVIPFWACGCLCFLIFDLQVNIFIFLLGEGGHAFWFSYEGLCFLIFDLQVNIFIFLLGEGVMRFDFHEGLCFLIFDVKVNFYNYFCKFFLLCSYFILLRCCSACDYLFCLISFYLFFCYQETQLNFFSKSFWLNLLIWRLSHFHQSDAEKIVVELLTWKK